MSDAEIGEAARDLDPDLAPARARPHGYAFDQITDRGRKPRVAVRVRRGEGRLQLAGAITFRWPNGVAGL